MEATKEYINSIRKVLSIIGNPVSETDVILIANTINFYNKKGDNTTLKDIEEFKGKAFELVSFTHMVIPKLWKVELSDGVIIVLAKDETQLEEIITLRHGAVSYNATLIDWGTVGIVW